MREVWKPLCKKDGFILSAHAHHILIDAAEIAECYEPGRGDNVSRGYIKRRDLSLLSQGFVPISACVKTRAYEIHNVYEKIL